MEKKSYYGSMDILEEDDFGSENGGSRSGSMERTHHQREFQTSLFSKGGSRRSSVVNGGGSRRSSVVNMVNEGGSRRSSVVNMFNEGRSRRSSVVNRMEKWGSQGELLSRSPSPTQFPKLPISRKVSGSWSRRASLVGEEYLKKDDEMMKIMRGGTTIELPRTISHHIPIIPIYNSEEFCEKINIKSYNIDDEDFQMYKKAEEFLYETPNHEADVTRVGQRKNIFKCIFKRSTRGKDLTLEELLDTLKELLGSWSQSELDEMIKMGYTPQEILNHFMDYGKTQDQEDKEYHRKLHRLIYGEHLSPVEILALLRKELGTEDRKKLENMLGRGHSVQQVVDYFMNREKSINLLDVTNDLKFKFRKDNLSDECLQEMKVMLADGFSMQEIQEYMAKHGRTQQEEDKKFADKMKNLVEGKDLSKTEIINLMEKELGAAGEKKMEELIKEGVQMDQIIDQFLNPKEEESEFSKMISKLSHGKDLNEEELLKLIKDNLGADSQKKMQEMLDQGFTQEEMLEYFMKHGKSQREEDSALVKRMKELLSNENLSPDGILAAMSDDLNEEDKRKMEQMIKGGCTIEEIMNHFKNRQDELEEEGMTEIQKKIHRMNKKENKTDKEMYEALHGMLGAGNKKRMEDMLAQGVSMIEIIKLFSETGKSQEQEDKELADKIKRLTDNKDMTETEFIELLRKELTDEQRSEMEQMLKDGYTLQDVIGKIVYHESEFKRRMKKLLNGKTLSQNELYNFIYDQLGPKSKKEMEAMLANGIPLEEIIQHFMSNGKSLEEEKKEFSDKMKQLIRGQSMSQEEILELLSNEFGDDQKLQLEKMLKSGVSIKDILDSFIFPKETKIKPKSNFFPILKQMAAGKKVNEEEMFNLIKNLLKLESREFIDNEKKKGSLLTEILDMLVESGMETQTSLEDILQFVVDYLGVKENLDPRAQSAMNDLLKQGCSIDEVMRLFEKYGNDLDGLCNDVIFKKHILVLTLPNSLFVIKRIKLRPPIKINNTEIN